jgi:hypothetical protein
MTIFTRIYNGIINKWAENKKAREIIMARNNHEVENDKGEREEGERRK